MDDAIGVLRVTRVVRHHADGGAAAMQFAQQFHHRFAVGRVEVSGRLVSEQDARLSANCAGHRHALLLTAGELAGQVLRAMAHADALERVSHALLALGGIHAAIGQRQLDVFINRQVADQVETLEDETRLRDCECARAPTAKGSRPAVR